MATEGERPQPSSAGADLDAYRRHRDEMPRRMPSAVSAALELLRPSDCPDVAFAGLCRISVPHFADGCDVEVGQVDAPTFRAHAQPDYALPIPTDFESDGRTRLLTTPFQSPGRGDYGSYCGIVTHWWHSREPTADSAVIADLMVKFVVGLVDRERAQAVLNRLETRLAEATMEAIAGRSVNLAVGMVMRQTGCSDGDAETLLRGLALNGGQSLYRAAREVILHGGLPERGAPDQQSPRGRRRLRSVDDD